MKGGFDMETALKPDKDSVMTAMEENQKYVSDGNGKLP